MIKANFKIPKIKPNNLFTIPRAAFLRMLSNNLARVKTIITMRMNVTENEMSGINLPEISNNLLKYSAERSANFNPPQTPNPRAIKDEISITKPLVKPLYAPHNNGTTNTTSK